MKHSFALALLLASTFAWAQLPVTIAWEADRADREIFVSLTSATLTRTPEGVGTLAAIDEATKEYEAAARAGHPLSAKTFQLRLNHLIDAGRDTAAFSRSASNYRFSPWIDAMGRVTRAAVEDLAVYTIPGGAAAKAVAQASFRNHAPRTLVTATDIGTDAARHYVGAGAQLDAQKSLEATSQEARRVLEKVYSLSKTDDVYYATVRRATSFSLAADARGSATENLARNPFLAAARASSNAEVTSRDVLATVSKMIDGQGRLRLSVSQIRDLEKRIVLAVNSEVTDSVRNVIQEHRRVDASKMAKEKNAVERRELLHSTAQLTVDLLGFFDPKAARAATTSISAALKTADAIDRFRGSLTASDVTGGALKLAAGLTGAAQLVFSLFAAGPSIEQLILDQIKNLSLQIETVQLEMRGRFDRIDRNLGIVFASMAEGFRRIDNRAELMHADIVELKNASRNLETRMGELEGTLRAVLEDGFLMKVEEEKRNCLERTEFAGTSAFEDCALGFRSWGTKHASNAVYAGGGDMWPLENPAALKGSDWLDSFIEERLRGDIWTRINFVKKLSRALFGHAALDHSPDPLVNPREWSRFSNDFLRFAIKHEAWSKIASDSVRSTTNALLSEGDRLTAALKAVSLERTSEPLLPLPVLTSLVTKTLDLYERANASLEKALDEHRESFETKVLSGWKLGADVAGQKVTLTPITLPEMAPCAGVLKGDPLFAKKSAIRLIAPSWDLDGGIPKAIRLIVSLNPEWKVEACYEAIGWSVMRDEPNFGAWEHHSHGRPFINVRLSLKHRETGTDIAFTRRGFAFGTQEHFFTRIWHHDFHPRVGNAIIQNPARLREAWASASVGMPVGESRLEAEVLKHWPSSAAGFYAGSSVMGTDTTAAVAQANSALTAIDAKYAEQYATACRRSFGEESPLRRVAKRAAGYFRLLHAYVQLGFPRSLAEDDSLRSFFFGNEALASFETLTDDARKITTANATRIVQFRALWIQIEEKRAGKESHDLIAETSAELAAFKKLQAQTLPRVSIDDAIFELRKRAEAFAQAK